MRPPPPPARSALTEIRQEQAPHAAQSAQTEISHEDAPPAAFVPEPEARHEGSHQPETPASAADEGAAAQVPPTDSPLSFPEGLLNATISKCAEARPSFFASVHQTAQSLAPAYALLTFMGLGGDRVIDAVIRHPEFPRRERAPRRDNAALIALLLAAKPENKQQQTWCYDWALMLTQAAHAGIASEDFAEWTAGVTLKECKAEVRKRRRQEKALAGQKPELPEEEGPNVGEDPEPASPPAEGPRLEIRLVNDSGVAWTLPLVITEQAFLKLRDFIERDPCLDSAEEVLRTLSRFICYANAPDDLTSDIPF